MKSNNMKTIGYLSKECEKCLYKDDCDEKRMEACMAAESTYKQPESLIAPAASETIAPLVQDMAIKHEYRDIKIDANTTVTIDLEDIKKKLELEIYKSLGCPFAQFGA